MKTIVIYFLIAGIYCGCKYSSAEKQTTEDSLQYYPPTPAELSKEEFRNYYRQLSDFFDSTLLDKGFNGGILVAKNGAVVYEKYVGHPDLRAKDTLTDTTAFHIASTSKTFTGIATLRLVQEQKLSLDDTLGLFFPGFPYPGVTVQMLLNHRSGLPNYLYFMSHLKWGIGPDGKWNKQFARNEDVLQTMIDHKPNPNGSPGTRFSYSNTNFVLLALIIEKITGKSYPEYMKHKFFEPLQMHHTYVFTLADTLRAIPSFTAGGSFWDYDFSDATYGDKNIYSTPRDLLKWDQALYTEQLIRPSLLDSAFTPYSNERPSVHNYGLGWRLQMLPNGKKIIYHFGRWHGFNSAFTRLTDEKATIIILGNKFTRSIYYTAHKSYDLFGNYLGQKDKDDEEADSLNAESTENRSTSSRRGLSVPARKTRH